MKNSHCFKDQQVNEIKLCFRKLTMFEKCGIHRSFSQSFVNSYYTFLFFNLIWLFFLFNYSAKKPKESISLDNFSFCRALDFLESNLFYLKTNVLIKLSYHTFLSSVFATSNKRITTNWSRFSNISVHNLEKRR